MRYLSRFKKSKRKKNQRNHLGKANHLKEHRFLILLEDCCLLEPRITKLSRKLNKINPISRLKKVFNHPKMQFVIQSKA